MSRLISHPCSICLAALYFRSRVRTAFGYTIDEQVRDNSSPLLQIEDVRLIALDSSRGDILWSFNPLLCPATPRLNSSEIINRPPQLTLLRLLPPNLSHRSARLLGITERDELLLWETDLVSGRTPCSSDENCPAHHTHSPERTDRAGLYTRRWPGVKAASIHSIPGVAHTYMLVRYRIV